MKMVNRLEALPNELLLAILQEALSPHDLYSVIRASRQCNIVYTANKKHVLSSIIRRFIAPEVIVDAYAACKAPRIATATEQLDESSHGVLSGWPYYGLSRVQDKAVRESIDDFNADYKQWRRHTGSLPLFDIPSLISMCRLWTITDAFISDYGVQVLDVLTNHPLLKDKVADRSLPGPPSPLSVTERQRLQRAFFRFEICRKLFGAKQIEHVWNRVSNPFDQFEAFWLLFEGWEVVEIRWIYEYLTGYMGRILNKVENDFVDHATSLSALSLAEPSDLGNDLGPGLRRIGVMDIAGLSVFNDSSKPSCQPHIIDFFLGRGLSLLHRLSRSTSTEQLRMVLAHIFTSRRRTYSRTLDLDASLNVTQAVNVIGSLIPVSAISKRPSPNEKPASWYWMLKPRSQVPPIHRSSVVSSGLIFWDFERLDVVAIETLDFNQFDARVSRATNPSVEERLEGVTIPTHCQVQDMKLLVEKVEY